MLDAFSATHHQRSRARKNTIRATRWPHEAHHRSRESTESPRRARVSALLRHGTQGSPAFGRPRRRIAEKMVGQNLRRDSKADWRISWRRRGYSDEDFTVVRFAFAT